MKAIGHLLVLAALSLKSRWLSACLTVASVAMGVLLFTGVSRIADQTRLGFEQSISGAHLIVGGRTAPTNLLLATIMHIGNLPTSMSRTAYDRIVAREAVAWAIPVSLGDVHRGFSVVATTDAMFKHYRFGDLRPLDSARGKLTLDHGDAVIGATVASELNYGLGQSIVLQHGAGDIAVEEHSDHPLRVAGILERTGTPVDRSIYIGQADEAEVHQHASGLTDVRSAEAFLQAVRDRRPSVSAVILGLRSPALALGLQREINEDKGEALSAIIPGLALAELWPIAETAETALRMTATLVLVASILGILIGILSGLHERRREIAQLRAIGARPGHVLALLGIEAGLTGLIGSLVGLLLLHLAILILRSPLEAMSGLAFQPPLITWSDVSLIALVTAAAAAVSLLPAYAAYRDVASNGLAPKL